MSQNQTRPMEELMKKLDGLRVMAERGTLHEAEIAAAKMQTELLKHNLTLRDVEIYAEQTKRSVEKLEVWIDSATWKSELAFRVATGHLCKGVMRRNCLNRATGRRGTQMTIFGHSHNLVVFQEIFQWLMKEVNRIADQELVHAQDELDDVATTRPKEWKNSFRHGAVVGIGRAFAAAKQTLQDATDSGTWALVPILEQEVEDALRAAYPVIGSYSLKVGGANAYHQGYNRGRDLNVASRQVGGAAHKAIG